MEFWDSFSDYSSRAKADKCAKKHRESCAKAHSKRKSKKKK